MTPREAFEKLLIIEPNSGNNRYSLLLRLPGSWGSRQLVSGHSLEDTEGFKKEFLDELENYLAK